MRKLVVLVEVQLGQGQAGAACSEECRRNHSRVQETLQAASQAARTSRQGILGQKGSSREKSSIPGYGSTGKSSDMGTNPSTVPGTPGTGTSSGSSGY